MYREKSFWLESIDAAVNYPHLQTDKHADVCIIGGGFTGLSTAIHLKEKNPNLKVILLESDIIGYGASGRNAGFSMRLFGVTMDLTKFRHGKDRTKEADAYMIDAVDYLESLIKRYDIDCDYERTGMITVATNRHELKHLQKEMSVAEELKLPGLRLLNEQETKQLVNSPTYLAARYDEHCALLHPAKLARELAKIAISLGVNVYEQSKVEKIDFRGNIISTTHNSIHAEKIVIATNAYSSFFKPLKKKQIPIYTYIVLTEPLSKEQLYSLNWDKRVGIEDARNFLHYYRLTPDNRILIGGSEALYYYGSPLDRDKNKEMMQLLQQNLLKIFPQLKGIKFTHHWGGPISATLDLIPTIGSLSDDVWYSMGCMGHGVSLTNYNGLTLSELILGEQTKRTEFFIVNRKVMTIPPEPLRYITVSAIRSYLRYEDRKGLKST